MRRPHKVGTAAFVFVAGIGVAIACNNRWNPNDRPWKPDIDFEAGSGATNALINAGLNKWKNTCDGAGQTWPDLTIGAGDVEVEVDYNDKSDWGSLPLKCGDFDPEGSTTEGTMVIYQWARDNKGVLKCDLDSTMAHETGHVLNFLHADGSNCKDNLMHPLDDEHYSDWIYDASVAGGRYREVLDRGPNESSECPFLDAMWIDPFDEEEEPECCTPLVLDLDMDGFVSTTSAVDYPVWFDLNGDGTLELTGWTNCCENDAFLWIDLNRNEIVDGGQELFGGASVTPDGVAKQDGFTALAVYDDPQYGGNGDGSISPTDAVWDRLLLWVDWNHDGISDRGESVHVGESDVVAISLTYMAVDRTDGAGNLHLTRGVYWSTRGLGGQLRAHLVEDILFKSR